VFGFEDCLCMDLTDTGVSREPAVSIEFVSWVSSGAFLRLQQACQEIDPGQLSQVRPLKINELHWLVEADSVTAASRAHDGIPLKPSNVAAERGN
jgi:hypothetical protein